MLLREQRRGHEHGDLVTGHEGDERRTQRNLGFTKADVTADHPIHGLFATEVGEHSVGGGELILRLLKREFHRETRIGVIGPGIGVAAPCRTPGVDLE